MDSIYYIYFRGLRIEVFGFFIYFEGMFIEFEEEGLRSIVLGRYLGGWWSWSFGSLVNFLLIVIWVGVAVCKRNADRLDGIFLNVILLFKIYFYERCGMLELMKKMDLGI